MLPHRVQEDTSCSLGSTGMGCRTTRVLKSVGTLVCHVERPALPPGSLVFSGLFVVLGRQSCGLGMTAQKDVCTHSQPRTSSPQSLFDLLLVESEVMEPIGSEAHCTVVHFTTQQTLKGSLLLLDSLQVRTLWIHLEMPGSAERPNSNQ